MQKLSAAVSVNGDPIILRQRLESEFLDTAKRFTVHLPLRTFGIPGDFILGKDIIVFARLVREEFSLNDQLYVEFKAATAVNLFPTFRGILNVYADEKQTVSILEIVGQYEPPLGMLGLAIDTTIGYAIAQQSVRDFLSQVAEMIHGPAQVPSPS